MAVTLIKWQEYGQSLNSCYQHWGYNVRNAGEEWTIYNFGFWLYPTYGLILQPDNDKRIMVSAKNKEDWIRFLLEWG